MKNTIIFDFDGVLADTLEPMLAYARQVCFEMDNANEPTQADLEALERMEFSEFGRQLGFPEEKIGDFVIRNFELFYQRKEPLKIITGMDEVVKKLSKSANLGVITGNSCAVVSKFLDTYELKAEFQTILGAEDDGNRVEKILNVVSLNGVSDGEVFMVGDAVSDIRAAREAGIKSIAVGWGHQSKEKLSTVSPDFWVDQPEDLLTLFSN